MSVSSRLRASGIALALSLAVGAGALAAVPASAAPTSASATQSVSAVAAKRLSTTKPVITGSARIGSLLVAKAGTWTKGTTFTYQWYAAGKAIKGAKLSKYRVKAADAGKVITVRMTGTKSGYVSKSLVSAPTAAVPAPPKPTTPTYPTVTGPIAGTWNCPSWAPIKGNASSMIYHVPGGAYYDRTNPEKCFATESAAQNDGFRASKR